MNRLPLSDVKAGESNGEANLTAVKGFKMQKGMRCRIGAFRGRRILVFFAAVAGDCLKKIRFADVALEIGACLVISTPNIPIGLKPQVLPIAAEVLYLCPCPRAIWRALHYANKSRD